MDDLNQLTNILVERANEQRKNAVVAITAIGGVGKSCLCRELIEQRRIVETFSRIIWFSFYEARAKTEDFFFHELLTRAFQRHFQESAEGAPGPADLRSALCKVLDESRALLILDGLEVVQFTDDPSSATYGAIKPEWSQLDKLLRHMLNRPSSSCLVTSRVPLRALENLRGYSSHPLDLFSVEDGGRLLSSLGVSGTTAALQNCSKVLGGHALSLVAAGRYMAWRKISADKLHDLVGDPDIFRLSPEGEKVKRISDWYRSELTSKQEYFLTRLSLHGRAVSVANYPVLIRDYKGAENDVEAEELIIQPLVDRGLVDRLASSDGVVRLTAHPLMKLAYSTWLEPSERKRAHEQWARAAADAPGLFLNIESAPDIDVLQPFIDATEQYLAAGNWRDAWNIFSGRRLSVRLMQLGCYSLAIKLARQFNEFRMGNDWTPEDSLILLDRLASLHKRLDLGDEALRLRREQLAMARQSESYLLPEVESLVAIELARAGYVREAAAIKPTSFSARGVIALDRGKFAQAVKTLSKVMISATGHDRTVNAQHLAEALYRSGHFDQAKRVLEDALSLAVAKQFTCCELSMLSHLTEAALLSRDLPKAREWFQIHNRLRHRLELPAVEDYWLRLEEGDFEGALDLANNTGHLTPRSLIIRHVQRARIFLKQSRKREALKELDAADREAEKSGLMRFRNEVGALRSDA